MASIGTAHKALPFLRPSWEGVGELVRRFLPSSLLAGAAGSTVASREEVGRLRESLLDLFSEVQTTVSLLEQNLTLIQRAVEEGKASPELLTSLQDLKALRPVLDRVLEGQEVTQEEAKRLIGSLEQFADAVGEFQSVIRVDLGHLLQSLSEEVLQGGENLPESIKVQFVEGMKDVVKLFESKIQSLTTATSEEFLTVVEANKAFFDSMVQRLGEEEGRRVRALVEQLTTRVQHMDTETRARLVQEVKALMAPVLQVPESLQELARVEAHRVVTDRREMERFVHLVQRVQEDTTGIRIYTTLRDLNRKVDKSVLVQKEIENTLEQQTSWGEKLKDFFVRNPRLNLGELAHGGINTLLAMAGLEFLSPLLQLLPEGAVGRVGGWLKRRGTGVLSRVPGFGLLGRLGRGALRLVPWATAALGAVSGVRGWFRAEDIFGVDKATLGQHVASALGQVISDFTLGLVPADTVTRTVYELGSKALAPLHGLLQGVVGLVEEGKGLVVKLVGGAVEKLSQWFDTVVGTLRRAFQGVEGMVGSWFKSIQESLLGWWSKVQGWIQSLSEWLGFGGGKEKTTAAGTATVTTVGPATEGGVMGGVAGATLNRAVTATSAFTPTTTAVGPTAGTVVVGGGTVGGGAGSGGETTVVVSPPPPQSQQPAGGTVYPRRVDDQDLLIMNTLLYD